MLSYGILCGLAVLSALLVRKQQRGAFMASLAILSGWVLFVASWTEYSPASLAPWLSYTERWALTDLTIATVILLLAAPRWWSLTLAAIIWVQIVLHNLHEYAGLEFAPYSAALDFLFLGQLAVFFMLGGGKIVDLMSSGLDHVAHVFRSFARASGQKEQAP